MTAISATGGTYRGHFTAAGDDFTPKRNVPAGTSDCGDIRIHIANGTDRAAEEKLVNTLDVLLRKGRPA